MMVEIDQEEYFDQFLNKLQPSIIMLCKDKQTVKNHSNETLTDVFNKLFS